MDIQKKVGDVEYSFQRMRVRESLAFKAELAKMAGPGLTGLNIRGKSFLDADVMAAIGAALSGSDPKQVAEFICRTIRSMVVFPPQVGKNGTEESFDKYYSTEEKEGELLEAFAACVEIQTQGTIGWLKKKFFANERPMEGSSTVQETA